jgi:hypothetical protein
MAIACVAFEVLVGACGTHGSSTPPATPSTGGGGISGTNGVTGGSAAVQSGIGGGFASGAGKGTDTAAGGFGPSMDPGVNASSAGTMAIADGSYFVSPDGSDTAPGTMNAPFRTIERARGVVRTVNAKMSDDIHVYLREGTYNITNAIAFGPQDSGTNGHRIFYEAYPKETPVLNGATKVTGWSASSGGVYQAQLSRSTKLRNLYVNDARASLTSKRVTAAGGYGTYAVTAGQASWAWTSGSHSDGAKYSLSDVPNIAKNKDDLEIVNATTWNENIVCVRDVITTSDNARALLFQQPYGSIAQLPGWDAEFKVTGALVEVGASRGKSSVQGATVFIAHGDGNYHNSKYRIIDTLPSIIHVTSADSLEFSGNVIKHSGSEGISFINDVVNSIISGNYIADIAGSGITIGHPQHVYIGDGGDHEKYAPGVEGVCKNDTITNNVLDGMTSMPGFGGHAGITAFFVDTLAITYNHLQGTAYNGINLGWGWRNFPDSTTCKNSSINHNRLFNTMSRLHDSGAVYTIGQMPGTIINENYVKGIPPATSGPTYGLHNDEGTAFITENDNVLDIDPGVKYTINCEDYGAKHDLTIRRTYATVNKMGVNPPNSVIDAPVAVPDNVWAVKQYETCLNAGVQAQYRSIIPGHLMSLQDYVLPASCGVAVGTASLSIRSSGDASNTIWVAPAGTTTFTAGSKMTKTAGDQISIAVPTDPGTYKIAIVDAHGTKLGESAAILRVR